MLTSTCVRGLNHTSNSSLNKYKDIFIAFEEKKHRHWTRMHRSTKFAEHLCSCMLSNGVNFDCPHTLMHACMHKKKNTNKVLWLTAHPWGFPAFDLRCWNGLQHHCDSTWDKQFGEWMGGAPMMSANSWQIHFTVVKTTAICWMCECFMNECFNSRG